MSSYHVHILCFLFLQYLNNQHNNCSKSIFHVCGKFNHVFVAFTHGVKHIDCMQRMDIATMMPRISLESPSVLPSHWWIRLRNWETMYTYKVFAESKSQEGHLTIVFNTNRSLWKQRARPLLVMRMNAVLHRLRFSFVHSVSDHKGVVFAKRTAICLLSLTSLAFLMLIVPSLLKSNKNWGNAES